MAMKSPALIQKESAYPPEFEKAVAAIKVGPSSALLNSVSILNIVRVNDDEYPDESISLIYPKRLKVVDSVALGRKTSTNPLFHHPYTPHLSSGAYFEALKATGNACAAVNKREQETLSDSFDRVFAPMKSWVEEDYPRLMKRIEISSSQKRYFLECHKNVIKLTMFLSNQELLYTSIKSLRSVEKGSRLIDIME
uniref:Uncharacterized protein n=1 Tax=Parascaris equorum TaxID=6256 RepID=A0A914SKG4_PAREQ